MQNGADSTRFASFRCAKSDCQHKFTPTAYAHFCESQCEPDKPFLGAGCRQRSAKTKTMRNYIHFKAKQKPVRPQKAKGEMVLGEKDRALEKAAREGGKAHAGFRGLTVRV